MTREHLRRLSDQLIAVQRPIRILKAINWGPAVHAQFFRSGCRELPRPEYAPLGFDVKGKLRELRELKRQIRGAIKRALGSWIAPVGLTHSLSFTARSARSHSQTVMPKRTNG